MHSAVQIELPPRKLHIISPASQLLCCLRWHKHMQMPSTSSSRSPYLCFLLLLLLASASHGNLSESFYSSTCPTLEATVSLAMTIAVLQEARIGASILRLFFHDCFVNGCDASVLLDDTATFTGEKNARPNANSLRGFEVIDEIKSLVETLCPATVSCADILALAARDGVVLLGGPSWAVQMGRRDATTASLSAAESSLPSPDSSLRQLISAFGAQGLNPRDLTALSGAHTIGQARCTNFRSRVNNDTDIDAAFAAALQETCSMTGSDDTLAPLDVQSADAFDNAYYLNLEFLQGLLHSDQELFNGGSQDSLVMRYADDESAFFSDFAEAMVKMGNIGPLTGSRGEIRLDCRKVN